MPENKIESNSSMVMRLKQLIKYRRLHLKTLILCLSVFSVSSLFFISLGISYYIQQQELINNSLSVNFEYASKIAQSTDQQFEDILMELAYSASIIGQSFDNHELIEAEVKHLKNQSNHFNSVVVVDHQGKFLKFAPAQLKFNTQIVNTTLGIRESLRLKKTFISPPYNSLTNNLIIFVSQPIFDKNNKYLGFVGGSIYLQKKNVITELFTIRYGYKNSYMYVLDQSNRMIFHPDSSQIGNLVTNNTGLAFMDQVKSGKIRLINSQGIDSLAGFAHIPSTGWTVVSQQPTYALLEQASTMIYKVSVGIISFYLLVFFTIWWISHWISSPLNHLAKMAGSLHIPDITSKIHRVEPWYYEVHKFKLSLLLSAQNFSERISELKHHVNTDPLTGFYNRRGLDIFVQDFIDTQTIFSVIAIDIDFFKNINDTYGHDRGDEVLRKVAEYIQLNFRDEDVCCRTGGEEFIVLAASTTKEQGYASAERLRHKLETTLIDTIGSVTVSIGIAHWPTTSTDIQEVFKVADEKLYQAKISGRNCICY